MTGDRVWLPLAPRSLTSMPTTGVDVPGVYVIGTESGTRYVLTIPPREPARALRISYYGYDAGAWRPFKAAHTSADGRPTLDPVQIGRPAWFQFTDVLDDHYRSTTVVSINVYEWPAILAIQELVAHLEGAMRSDVAAALIEAYDAGRCTLDDLAEACRDIGIDFTQLTRHLGAVPGDDSTTS